jgi:transposase, IS5 family
MRPWPGHAYPLGATYDGSGTNFAIFSEVAEKVELCLFSPRGKETRVWGDAAYAGQRDIIRERAPKARDFTQQKATRHRPLTAYQRTTNRTKSSVRAKVEHIIGVIKRVFGFAKVRYRGLAKNAHRLFVTCALANLFMVRRHLLRVA